MIYRILKFVVFFDEGEFIRGIVNYLFTIDRLVSSSFIFWKWYFLVLFGNDDVYILETTFFFIVFEVPSGVVG